MPCSSIVFILSFNRRGYKQRPSCLKFAVVCCVSFLWALLIYDQLESAATAGVVLVAALIALLAAEAFKAGFPAIRNGDLQLWSLKVDSHLPEAFAVVGYAFYMQASHLLCCSCFAG